jgi:Family of unknown function (DUF6348)
VFDAAVAVGIGAFFAGDGDLDDDEIVARLESQGVSAWLAERLVAFLPMAYGRVILRDCHFEPTFVDGSVTRPLDGDPVWRAVWARAQQATREEAQRIGLRSAAVNAANKLLHEGSQLADLMFTADRLVTPLPPLPPLGQGDDDADGDGGVPSPRAAFAKALSEHGFQVAQDAGGLHVGRMRFDARLFPHPSPQLALAQVDFEVRHPALAKDRLVESVAAVGQTWNEAVGRATGMFARGSLHPITNTLLGRSHADGQVEWERYEHPGGPFDLCLGPQLNLFSPEPAPPVGPLLDALLDKLRQEPLSPAVHWIRLFLNYQDGRLACNEVLLDNDTWEAGQDTVAAANLDAGNDAGNGFRGIRIFGMLTPAR